MEQQKNNSDLLLALVVGWMFLSRVFWFIIPKLFETYYTLSWFSVVSALFGLIWAGVPFAIAFAIKDKEKQLLTFIFAGLCGLFSLYELITPYFGSAFKF